jgi:hypothetical protein
MTILDEEQTLTTRQKALKINLDRRIYGSFAEIGAGQEVASFFFKAGGASGTIAKTMSAYDMTFSNAIYGEEESGRYVCEPRLDKMISKEYNLLELRLDGERGADTTFFSYANTVVAINYQRTNQGHGWMGVRFQLTPRAGYNDAVIHVRMHDKETLAQQQACGVLGVNLLYACFYHNNDPQKFLSSLLDGLSRDRAEVDMIRLEGPDFDGKFKFDNRLLSLQLVKYGLTEATIFNPDGDTLQPTEALYKKNILVLRGRFRPVTHVNVDMLRTGREQFLADLPEEERKHTVVLAELTLHDLKAAHTDIDEKDFLDRVDILCSLGQTVMISNYHEYHRLVNYLAQLTKKKIGIVMGIFNLESIFHEKYYTSLKGGILEAFSQLFMHYIKVYVYPYQRENGEIYNIENFKLPPNQVDLFEYLIANHKIADLKGYRTDAMHIISDHVLAMIRGGIEGWETMVPPEVKKKIIEGCLFGYPCDLMEKRKEAETLMLQQPDKILQKNADTAPDLVR